MKRFVLVAAVALSPTIASAQSLQLPGKNEPNWSEVESWEVTEKQRVMTLMNRAIFECPIYMFPDPSLDTRYGALRTKVADDVYKQRQTMTEDERWELVDAINAAEEEFASGSLPETCTAII